MEIIFATPGLLTDPNSVEGKRVRKIVSKCAKLVGSATYKPGFIVFHIAKAFRTAKAGTCNAKALEALMSCLTDLDCLFLKCKPLTEPLFESGVYYKRTQIWDSTPALYARGYGDCKSLTACRVAELRAQGIACRPVFRFHVGETGTMFHILVMLPDGTFRDPSKTLGMQVPAEFAD